MFTPKSNKPEMTPEQLANRNAYDLCEEQTLAARSIIGANQHTRRLQALLKIKTWGMYPFLKESIRCETRLAERERNNADLVDFAVSSSNPFAYHALERANSVKFMDALDNIQREQRVQSTFV